MGEKPRSIDEYLARLDAGPRAALERVRAAVRAAAPAAEECFSYGMPAFRLGGALIAGFAAGARHCAFYPMSGSTVASLGDELAGYETSKGAVRFAADRGLPARLVRKLVKTRLAEVAGGVGPSRETSGSRSSRRAPAKRRPRRRV
jgi:uncharacterized protein YdhG (YjbR/CyaY superfamily)